MLYKNIVKAEFVSRPNRFIAKVISQGEELTVHVKNTGRCKELLTPGCTVYLEKSDNPDRKTGYDLVMVEKGDLLINMDSNAPNYAFEIWAQKEYPGRAVKREVTYGDSRFDFLIENEGEKTFVEVKGVTLEENGAVYFPDAPTERGIKHLSGLERAIYDGYNAWIFFVIQMDRAKFFSPNYKTHPRFGEALKRARASEVKIKAYTCKVTLGDMEIDSPVKIVL